MEWFFVALWQALGWFVAMQVALAFFAGVVYTVTRLADELRIERVFYRSYVAVKRIVARYRREYGGLP